MKYVLKKCYSLSGLDKVKITSDSILPRQSKFWLSTEEMDTTGSILYINRHYF